MRYDAILCYLLNHFATKYNPKEDSKPATETADRLSRLYRRPTPLKVAILLVGDIPSSAMATLKFFFNQLLVHH